MNRVIVTGAYGFIGRRLIERLSEQGIVVYAIYRGDYKAAEINSNIVPIQCDMKDIRDLKDKIGESGFDAFYHLAWDGGSGISRTDYTKQLQNVKYVCDVALVAKKMSCQRLIVTGTISENIVENSITDGYTSQNLIYAISKDTAHRILDYICRTESQEYCWARLSNVIGADDCSSNIIAYTIREMQKGRIPEYGKCDQVYDFVYVDDVVEALINIGMLPSIRSQYTVSSGFPMTLREYLEKIAEKFHGTLGIGKRKSDNVEYRVEWFDNETAKQDLVMRNIHSFEDALTDIMG